MRRKKLKAPKYAGEEFSKEYAFTLKQCASQRTAFEASLKLSSSPEAYSVVSEIGSEFIKTQRDLDGMTAQILFDLEQEIQSLRADKTKLEREKKGLLIELRKSMKIKDVEEKADTEETMPDEKVQQKRKRGAPVGHRGNSRPIPRFFNYEEVVPPPPECDCGCCQILPLDESDDKYIEDISPVVKIVTKIRYLMGKCAGCGKIVPELHK
ncbi:MAG: hypothetical protein KAT34_06355 [Candidatus Aminicenantes bacterium]|nr:hypothetical protein [Candidatus Aminicenantes bacterium]